MTGTRILLMAYGTRGDVEPFLALGLALKARGAEVSLATSPRFRARVEALGFAAHDLSDAPLALMDTPEGKALVEGTRGAFTALRAGMRMQREATRLNAGLMRDTVAAARAAGPNLVVYHPKLLAAPHVAEAMGVPAAMGALQPMFVPTAAFPAPGMPRLGLPGYNRLTYAMIRLSYGLYRKQVNRLREEELGLAPVRTRAAILRPHGVEPVLHAISPAVLPRPADWPGWARMTGFWQMPGAERFAPPADLAAFVEAGPPPVYVGFGSMPATEPGRLGRVIAGALERAGVRAGIRAVVFSGPEDLGIARSEKVFLTGPVPHSWLFPRTGAVVHHGGAGTTAAAFRAGVPQVVCPVMGDQPFWARCAVEAGTGTAPLPRRRLDAERLARSIQEALHDPGHRKAAASVAARMADEDGAGLAAEELLALVT